MSDTIAAVSTGMQVSAIGILRLSGDEAINIVDKLFIPRSGKKMSESEDRKLVFGSLCDLDGQTLDICLCTISRAPHSYTGENTAEISCNCSKHNTYNCRNANSYKTNTHRYTCRIDQTAEPIPHDTVCSKNRMAFGWRHVFQNSISILQADIRVILRNNRSKYCCQNQQ